MIDHVRDLASVREATDRFLSAAGKLDDAAVAGPSRLPGWTRGHVLAHVARNADALVNVLAGRPMYASSESRDADIARDAGRPLEAHLADLRDSAARLTAEAAAPADWSRTVVMRNGVTDRAARVPFRRWIELELHLVDLDAGYELQDLPEEFTDREIGFLAERWSGRPELPAVTLVADGGRSWRTGGTAEGAPVTVTGSPAALLGWLAGRGDKGATLETTGGALPALPPL
ncbi:maleylpyruvate isomerase family mycothiol-dependent enzyme [Streptomyces roseoverticillatus]|uniref:maleylpyruvate isomerase family mycothiol-dependent enzyme n=1 Tax=Streptomyces roseoverticillatus TaxID=66429 RepID=UPI001F27334F|nr:maleylpyruvate isomerase family mycothiol-dependent enzyme [Streptomyces roseoverticillatus]MCF3104972.1 maleylpyruvate isomerase family mycothiol-dependent enzyme [Streptomyces roseoverticillatus]